MTQKVSLTILSGDLSQQGYSILLRIQSSHKEIEKPGLLPANPQLAQQLENWQEKYQIVVAPNGEVKNRGIKLKKIEVKEKLKAHKERINACQESSDKLTEKFNEWLRNQSFLDIRESILSNLSKDEELRFLIRTDDWKLQQLPWHKWEIVEKYINTEITFSKLNKASVTSSYEKNRKVRILAILGDSEGINIEQDRIILEKLPNVDLKLISETNNSRPFHELFDKLFHETWDIFFFAGHSATINQEGKIYLKNQDSCTVDNLWMALRQAVERGLKLAIFNSCDGLGIARQLNDLSIPQMIIMREVVPDEVAQEFLKKFLECFSQGDSFTLAVKTARQYLQKLEKDFYPCATWLPVIYGDGIIPNWDELYEPPPPEPQQPQQPSFTIFRKRFSHRESKSFVLLGSLLLGILSCSLVISARNDQLLQPLELISFDFLMRSRPVEKPDDRLLIIKINPEDQAKYGTDSQSISNENLAQLLTKLNPNDNNPSLIVLGLIRRFSKHKYTQPESLIKIFQESKNLISQCELGFNEDKRGNPPDPYSQQNFVGFSDIPMDDDGITRTQFLTHPIPQNVNFPQPCESQVSLSFKVAGLYLMSHKEKIKNKDGEFNFFEQSYQNKPFRLGQVKIYQINAYSGGYNYRNTNLIGGYQIFLNYRSLKNPKNIASTISLTDVLENKIDPSLIKNKIVMIGTEKNLDGKPDVYPTPYGNMLGIVIQSHMISQILSAVMDERPLIQWWTQKAENIWIFILVSLGGIIAWLFHRKLTILLGGVALILLLGCTYILLLSGFWIPLTPSALSLILGLVGTLTTISLVAIYDKRRPEDLS